MIDPEKLMDMRQTIDSLTVAIAMLDVMMGDPQEFLDKGGTSEQFLSLRLDRSRLIRDHMLAEEMQRFRNKIRFIMGLENDDE